MRRFPVLLQLLSLTLLVLFSRMTWAYELCPGVVIQSENKIAFSLNERRFLCGDPNSHAWQKIPPAQARYFANSFLQARGYLNPRFEIDSAQLTIHPGNIVRVMELSVEGAPEDFDPSRKRNLRGRPLTPDVLNEVESWAKARLQELGYACVKLSLEATPEQGLLRIKLQPGPRVRFGEIKSFGLSTSAGLVERQHAFLPLQVFDPRLLQLSTNRLIADELYIGSYFDLQCDRPLGPQDEIEIHRHLVSATPRLLTFGLGVDSEVGPVLRSSFRHVLLTPNGTHGQLTLTASYREQSFEAKLQHYPLDNSLSRFYVEPRFIAKREREEQFDSLSTQFSVSPGWSLETEGAEHRISLGPAVEEVHVSDATTGPQRTKSLFFAANLSSKSHLFEYYVSEPQTGWNISLSVSSKLRGIASPVSIHRFQMDAQRLWNLFSFDPPLLVIGSRTRWGSFYFENTSEAIPEVPVSQRFFIGGDGDLRGFARKQLPLDASGFLSAFTQNFELRFVEILPWKLQPLLIFDLGFGGSEALKLDPAMYYSPGLGLRWSSPLGPVRATVAQGRVLNPEPGSEVEARWQAFVSFGREF